MLGLCLMKHVWMQILNFHFHGLIYYLQNLPTKSVDLLNYK